MVFLWLDLEFHGKLNLLPPEVGHVRYFPNLDFALFPLTSPGFVRVLFGFETMGVGICGVDWSFHCSLTAPCGDSIISARVLVELRNWSLITVMVKFGHSVVETPVGLSDLPNWKEPRADLTNMYSTENVNPTFTKRVKSAQPSSLIIGDIASPVQTRSRGLQVEPRSVGSFISQDKYVAEILRKFDLESVKTATTPYEPQKPKDKNGPDDDVNVHLTDQ
ncbi:hypothetical protein Tco_0408386 [Tanacetum coccineum]